jgi:hypothetical protein
MPLHGLATGSPFVNPKSLVGTVDPTRAGKCNVGTFTGGGSMRSRLQGAAALIVLLSALALNSGGALAQTVNLLCSGTFSAPEFYVAATPTRETIVVDFGSQTVRGPTGTYPFASSNETRIEFYSAYLTKGDMPMVASGKIDRVSGETTITVKRQNQPQGISLFCALSCHPARPAF